MSDDKPDSPASQQVLNAPDTTFNAVGCGVSGTQWYAQFDFHDSIVMGDKVLQRTAVVAKLPWPLAKALSQLLAETVSRYEQSEGPLELPKSYVDAREAQFAAAKKTQGAGRKKAGSRH